MKEPEGVDEDGGGGGDDEEANAESGFFIKKIFF